MANGFQVDLYALEQAASGVNGTLDMVGQQRVSDIAHDSTAIGHDGLAGTLSDFLDRWQRGVDNLAKDGREIAARLTANVNAYREAETNAVNQTTAILKGMGADPGVR